MRLLILVFTIVVLARTQLESPGQERTPTSRSGTRPSTSRSTRKTTGRPGTRCGRRVTIPKPFSFVIGGRPAQVGQFPWAVQALRSDGTSCGGTLLSNKWVLSAAHCHEEGVRFTKVMLGVTKVKGGEKATYRVKRRKGDIIVGAPQVVEVGRAIVHPNYRRDSHNVALNDLVLLELKVAVKFGPLVQPICLPPGEGLNKGVSTVAGWGLTKNYHVSSPNHLQWVDLDILSDAECTLAYKTLNTRSRNNKEDSGIRLDPAIHLCAGGKVGEDSCEGDSGGPLVVRDGGQSYLVGVVSGGPVCAQGFAGYYAKVSSYLKWINIYL